MSHLRFILPDGRPDRAAARSWVRRQAVRNPLLLSNVSPHLAREFAGWNFHDWYKDACREWKSLARAERSIWLMRAGRHSPVSAESARQLSSDGAL